MKYEYMKESEQMLQYFQFPKAVSQKMFKVV